MTSQETGNSFNVWVFGDCHVGTDLKHGRQSLAEILEQSEMGRDGAPPFDWDIAIDVGDMSGEQGLPADPEGEEIVRQFGALRRHRREDIYNVCGNHDRSGLHEPQNWWWRKWLDPMGEHTECSGVNAACRPFPVSGTWERYSFRVGNLLFLMMSDINEPSQDVGRGDLGGNPGGVVSGETFEWWRNMVEANPEAIIVSVHHYVLKDTTVASGEWEGMQRNPDGSWRNGYHGYKPGGTPIGASYLYWVGSQPDAQAFESYLAQHPGAIDLWLGGHTHASPDDMYGGKSHVEKKWGTTFINAGAVTKHHLDPAMGVVPKSWVLSFLPGRREVRVRCCLHTDDLAAPGWYAPAERVAVLGRRFRMDVAGSGNL